MKNKFEKFAKMTEAELNREVFELKAKIVQAKIEISNRKLNNFDKVKKMRRDIARAMTAISIKKNENE